MNDHDDFTAELEALELPEPHEFLASARETCTGDYETCLNDECFACAFRDCPHGELLHYHHDGCPACEP